MPYADPERNRACVRDWMRRNTVKVKAAKLRYRERRKRIREASPRRQVSPASYFNRARREAPHIVKYYYKLRRNGVSRDEARRLAFNR